MPSAHECTSRAMFFAIIYVRVGIVMNADIDVNLLLYDFFVHMLLFHWGRQILLIAIRYDLEISLIFVIQYIFELFIYNFNNIIQISEAKDKII